MPKGAKGPSDRCRVGDGHRRADHAARATPGGRVQRRPVHELTEQLHVELQKLFDEASRPPRPASGPARSQSVEGVTAEDGPVGRASAAGIVGAAPSRATARTPATTGAAAGRGAQRGGGKYSSSSVTRDLLDAVAGREPGDDRLARAPRAPSAGGDADHAGQVVGQLVGAVDPVDPGGSRPPRPRARAPGCSTSWPSRSRRRRRSAARSPSAPPGGWWWRSTGRCGPGIHRSGKRVLRRVQRRRPSRRWLKRGLGQQRHRLAEVGQRGHSRPRLDPAGSASGATAIVPTASSWPSWPT